MSSKVKRIDLFTGYSIAIAKGDIESDLFSSVNRFFNNRGQVHDPRWKPKEGFKYTPFLILFYSSNQLQMTLTNDLQTCILFQFIDEQKPLIFQKIVSKEENATLLLQNTQL